MAEPSLLKLQPGGFYKVTAQITNKSTEGGKPVAATFTIEWRLGLLRRPLLPTPCGNIGDVNEDGTVNVGDVIVMDRFVMGAAIPTPEQMLRADVDGNGLINVGDVIQIKRYIMGADTVFWVCALPPPAGKATAILLNTSTEAFFAPGEQRVLTYEFRVPFGIVEDMGLAQVTVLAEGQQLAKHSQALEVAAAVETFYPLDDWIRVTQTTGAESEKRTGYLLVGWTGGEIMEKEEGVIYFEGLPTNIPTQALLILIPTEYVALSSGDETIVKVNGQEVARDKLTLLAPLRIDITPFLQGGDGTLLVELSPTPVSTVRNWFRRYGSIRSLSLPEVRPKIEVF